MEYEKHIKRLVLGYLKTACKSSYRRFSKTHFHSQQKHIATRVGGQTLEDILKIYSRIQDIIQGRLEDTEYYKDYGAEYSSPIYLAEQLTYLLDRDGRFISESSVCGRSPTASSITDTCHEQEDVPDHVSDTETTPEHTLPGNIQRSEDNGQCGTPFRRKSPIFKTPYLEKLPIGEQENISSVMSMKLLEKRGFSKKLAKNINTVYTPQFRSTSHNVPNSDKKSFGGELEETIRNAVTRIEADPMFEDLLQDFMDPVANSLAKVIPADNPTQSRRSSYSRNLMEEERDNGTSSPMLNQNDKPSLNTKDSTVNENVPNKDANKCTQGRNELIANAVISEESEGHVASLNQLEEQVTGDASGKTTSQQVNNVPSSGQVEFYSQSFPVGLQTPEVCNYHPGTSQSGSQQQFYIVNQPLLIPQTNQVMQLIQPIQTVPKPITVDYNVKIIPKTNTDLTEQDIMSMPTIILNERNEVTYADPGAVDTPLKLGEVHNIKDYFKVFGATDQSPVIKKSRKNVIKGIKPTPTIKVEIFKRNSPLKNTEDVVAEPPKTVSNPTKALPSLNETIDLEQESSVAAKSTACENKVNSNDEIKSSAVCTPSPLITTARKPTPKSSSHIRNLTFPSPLRKTPSEKADGNQNSPSAINKQQAAKDLFKNAPEEEESKKIIQQKMPLRGKCKNSTKSDKTEPGKSPKKTSLPKKQDSPKKSIKTSKKNEKLEKKSSVEHTTPNSWDASLRKNVSFVVEQNHSTPVRRATLRKRTRRSTDLNVSDPDGKKVEDALKTPRKTEKAKGKKTPSKKKTTKIAKPKPEKKLADIEEEAIIEPKKILSPSKLCNTTSKRNMEVDSIKPNSQLVSNARKNITSLLETPLKEGVMPSNDVSSDPTINTPFTPMLKANLKDFTVGDTFSIDTPNVPVTPGMTLMENSSAGYYILNDTETNKATDAIVLSEERKSSVRKTDDEDFEMSPKVYGCKEILDNFNKSRAGEKNLELIESKGVVWDGSSDKEYKSGNSESNSDNESNNTVINSKAANKVGNSRISQKNMAVLRSQILDKTSDMSDISTTSEAKIFKENPDHLEDMEANSNKNDKISVRLKENGSSSDSEIISKEDFNVVQADNCGKNICNENSNTDIRVGGDEKDNISKDKIQEKVLENDEYKDVMSLSIEESIKSVIINASLENCTSHMTTAYSLKAEMAEKRKRMIELEKAGTCQTPKSCTRRRSSKSQRSINTPSNKRKQSSPTKVVKRATRQEQSENNGNCEKVDSQDEFFKKSGSNLHRTNKQPLLENISSTEDAEENIVNDSQTKNESGTKIGNAEDKLDGQKPNEANDTTDNVSDDANVSLWDSCVIELQPEEIVIVYDETKTSKKRLSDYNLNLEKKGFKILVPLTDGSTETIQTAVTPFKALWEISPATSDKEDASVTAIASATLDCSNDSENTTCKVGDLDALRSSKKRKQRSDSCNSNSSSKRIKTSLLPDFSSENIEKILTKLHGPSEKT